MILDGELTVSLHLENTNLIVSLSVMYLFPHMLIVQATFFFYGFEV
jgi:hypothetical protein